jgi:hypothetical protein
LLNPNPIDLRKAVKKYKEYDGWREFYPEAQEELPTGMPTPVTKNWHKSQSWWTQTMHIVR